MRSTITSQSNAPSPSVASPVASSIPASVPSTLPATPKTHAPAMPSMTFDYDILIIGAGAAGLTAAVYTTRKKLKTGIISIDVGGQTNLTSNIENYPGVDAMHGAMLMQEFLKKAVSFGATLVSGKVGKVEKLEPAGFKIHLKDGQVLSCKALILAFGKVPRTLGIPGEDHYFGKGISTCVTCDGPLFNQKDVVIVGGGNSAIEGALELSHIAKKVYLIHRRDKFTADAVTVDKLKAKANLEIIYNSVCTEVKGDKFVRSVTVEDVNSKAKRDLAISGMFLEIGFIMDISMLDGLGLQTNEKKEVVTDLRCNTNVPGIFAAGDCTIIPYKQTVISAGEGAKAALEAHRYLTGAKGITLDWDH
ncbi:FAD-dependent oxidoreductase [Candidatus Micrarchaeota archaeon]|nr:FAD-dependent oxidoreductase [Candidatus Micrarchaeota archaeon]